MSPRKSRLVHFVISAMAFAFLGLLAAHAQEQGGERTKTAAESTEEIKRRVTDELMQRFGQPQARQPMEEEENEGMNEAPPGEVIFSILPAFPEANVQRRKKWRWLKGWWDEKGFKFEDSPIPGPQVFIDNATPVNGRVREAILVQLEPGSETTVSFTRVPPGRILRVLWALPDSSFEGEEKIGGHVKVGVSIGQKNVFETQISTKGWKENLIDLALPRLLGRAYVLTFTIRSVDSHWKSLLFYGYIE